MQSARREHAKLSNNHSEYETNFLIIKKEVTGIKKRKVALVTKMKEESRRHQEAEKQYKRQIAQMQEVSCQQGNSIRSLEAHNRTKARLLKRRHDEMATLRRQTLTETQ
ncbi:hypothetical protein MRX96_035283 [Rhipicephalus microplus]